MKINILSTKEAPRFLNRIFGQVSRGPAPSLAIKRSEIPYWRQQGWNQVGRTYHGTYKTPYGSFIGRIEEAGPRNFRLYIFDPPTEIRKHAHWACFQTKGDRSFRIHMSRMPNDVSSGILAIERLLTEAFEKP